MSLCVVCHMLVLVGFPRVSGDEPVRHDETEEDFKFSPRERG